MIRTLFLFWLGLATLIEFGLALGGLFAPDFLRAQFHIGTTEDTRFLTYVVAWLILMIAIACALAWRWSFLGKSAGYVLTNWLGLFWIGIGIGIYFQSNGVRTDNLALDSAKGAILVLLNYLNDRFG